MTESSQDGVFKIDNPNTILRIPVEEVEATLGFTQTTFEKAQTHIAQLQNLFRSTVSIVDYDPKKRVFVDDPQRLNLPLFPVEIFERDGKPYSNFTLSEKLRMITQATPSTLITGPDAPTQGYDIEHLLLLGQHDVVLDLMSVRTGDKARNMFSFSDLTPHFKRRRIYLEMSGKSLEFPRNKDNSEHGPDVLLTVPALRNVEGLLVWDPAIFPFIMLHENGHAANAEVDIPYSGDSVIPSERRANAVALQTIRRVNQQYSSDEFFDLKHTKTLIRDQLMHGYGAIRETSNS